MSADTQAGLPRLRVASPVAPLQREPRVSAPQTSQLLAGHTVTVFETQGDWMRVAGADAYEGWMHRGYLEDASGDEAEWDVSISAVVRLFAGPRRHAFQTLPLGARVDPSADIISGTVVSHADLREDFPADGTVIVQSTCPMFAGASYLWGGVTPWGCDCSGFVQSVFALHGVQLPRDAWQQASVGVPVSVTPRVGAATTSLHPASTLDEALVASLESGDLLFFSDREDRHITHVGIAAEGGTMTHSALGRGGVHVEFLTSDDPYMQRLRPNFITARRVV